MNENEHCSDPRECATCITLQLAILFSWQIVKVTEHLGGSSVKLPKDWGTKGIGCQVTGSLTNPEAVRPMLFALREESPAH